MSPTTPAGRVSVVIPTFNLGAYLPEAIESVRRQTVPAGEILVVNDGSDDPATIETLLAYESEPEITVFHTVNRGAPAARNYGIAHARHEYVLCLDADDVLMPDFLESTVPWLDRQPQTGIVCGHVEFFGERQGHWRPPGYDPDRLLFHNCIPSASLFRRRCWEESGGYKDLPGAQDWEFWISIVKRGWEWWVVPRTLYRYRVRAESISATREARRSEILRQIIDLHEDVYRERFSDLLIGLDAELQAVRERLQAGNGRGREDERSETIRRTIDRVVPVDAAVMVLGPDEFGPEGLGGRTAWFFDPRPTTGETEAEVVHWMETLRAAGAGFLVVPPESLEWLRSEEPFQRHLEREYRVAAREEGVCLVWDVRRRLEPVSFSVVICTRNRAALLDQAIASVMAQDYPPDRFEVVVVDNNSTDGTAAVAARWGGLHPDRFRYVVEPRNGIAFARNLGVREARHEYVAFLDDDETACSNWLLTFNALIHETHALVVGGRVERRFEPGFVSPDWFGYPYVSGFFGVNYRERGKPQEVIRIRPPLYIGAGNSAYARRLFDRFGHYETRLGRNERNMMAAEETHFNLLLMDHDIPIWYSDRAYILHHLEATRLTQPHIRRRAWWNGVSNAVVAVMRRGPVDALADASASWREIRILARRLIRTWRHPSRFATECRLINLFAFLWKLYRVSLAQRITGRRYPARIVSWTTEDWIREVERWPDDVEKHRQLYHLYESTGDTARSQAAFERLMALRPPGIPPSHWALDRLWGSLEEIGYTRLVERIRGICEATLPAGSPVIVVSKGDDALVRFAEREGWHFPQTADGVYAGHHPSDSREAIEHLESLRRKGGQYLLLPLTSFWWLDSYPDFRRHLEERYRTVVRSEDACLIYALEEEPR